jgi:hypothetical protein
MFSEGEVKSTYFLQVWWALKLPCIVISYCCLCQCQELCNYYMSVSTKYHWNISFQKKCSSKYVVKTVRNVTQFVWQHFSIQFQGFVKKRIKYIHQNLRYYETIEQIHLMVVKIESYVWEKIVISEPLLYRRPFLLWQQKNN